ncbi:MAG TPA: POTRA domain-containing protein, partial [Thermoanaerobaculia bacterium]|nr:POTRA domain-containing protein [Thermoanaerobaculia bacterium]
MMKPIDARASLIPRATVVVLLLICAAPLAAQFEFKGEIIRSIELSPDAPYETPELERLLVTRVGDPLTITAVQESVKAIFATGDFRDVRVDATPVEGGVALRFLLTLHYRVARVEIAGAGEELGRAQRESRIAAADVLSLSAVDRSAVAIQRALARRGYLEVTVDPEVRFMRAENRADVIFHVELGPLAHVASVDLQGNFAPFTAAELIDRMESKPGEVYQIQEARRDADRIRERLARRNYRMADVRFLGGDESYDPETHTAVLPYQIEIGPIVKVVVEGVPSRRIRRLLPFRDSPLYSEDLIFQSADQITDWYQRRGYFLATVEVEEREIEGEHQIVFQIDPGRRYAVGDVRFEGNEQIPDRRLRDVIGTAPVGGVRGTLARLFRRPIGLTHTQLNDDRDALEAFYRLEGFTQVRVGRATAVPVDGDLQVTFPIIEGTQTLVRTLAVEGNRAVSDQRLPSLLSRPGEPLNPQELSLDTIALKTFYAEQG